MFRDVEYFTSKANRDARYQDIKSRGFDVRKRSCRNSVLSPGAVEDFTGRSYPNGFGGSADQFFSVLYTVEY